MSAGRSVQHSSVQCVPQWVCLGGGVFAGLHALPMCVQEVARVGGWVVQRWQSPWLRTVWVGMEEGVRGE